MFRRLEPRSAHRRHRARPRCCSCSCALPFALAGTRLAASSCSACRAALVLRRLAPGLALGIAWATALDPDGGSARPATVRTSRSSRCSTPPAAYGGRIVRWLGLASAPRRRDRDHRSTSRCSPCARRQRRHCRRHPRWPFFTTGCPASSPAIAFLVWPGPARSARSATAVRSAPRGRRDSRRARAAPSRRSRPSRSAPGSPATCTTSSPTRSRSWSPRPTAPATSAEAIRRRPSEALAHDRGDGARGALRRAGAARPAAPQPGRRPAADARRPRAARRAAARRRARRRARRQRRPAARSAPPSSSRSTASCRRRSPTPSGTATSRSRSSCGSRWTPHGARARRCRARSPPTTPRRSSRTASAATASPGMTRARAARRRLPHAPTPGATLFVVPRRAPVRTAASSAEVTA